jgi:hypothetical protein
LFLFYSFSSKRIHRDKPVKPSDKYEIIEETPTTTKLIIHDVTPDDESPIQITVKNALGQSDTTVQLKALGLSKKTKFSIIFFLYYRNTAY